MNEVFASIYENSWFGIYNQSYPLIFDNFYDNGGYAFMGLSFILIPLACMALFYIFCPYPYSKLWHWLVCLLVTTLIVSVVSYGIANTEIFASNNQALNDALNDASTGYYSYATSLPFLYTLINGVFTIIIGFGYSLFLKRFSKIQTHLPF